MGGVLGSPVTRMGGRGASVEGATGGVSKRPLTSGASGVRGSITRGARVAYGAVDVGALSVGWVVWTAVLSVDVGAKTAFTASEFVVSGVFSLF